MAGNKLKRNTEKGEVARKKLKRNTAKDEASSILPGDVIETILSRLPVKSLLRFKIVSKSWKATISDPRFSEVFNIRQSTSQNLFLLWRAGNFSLIKLEDNKFRTESVLENPSEDSYPLCSCNGIVLLKASSDNEYVLWNPTIRKHIRIRCPHKLVRYRYSKFNYGLYYDSRIDDYKVVIISEEFYTVFSCKSRTWAEKKPSPCNGLSLYPCWAVFVDGSFYWWRGPEAGEESHRGEIVYFDVRDEKLKTLQRPNDMKANGKNIVQLILLSGRLCLYRRDRDITKLQIWVMEKQGRDQNYSWKELMNMEKEEPQFIFYNPICLTNEDNVVIHLMGSSVVIYNNREKRIEKSWRFYGLFYSKLLLCSESLIFPIQNTEPINA